MRQIFSLSLIFFVLAFLSLANIYSKHSRSSTSTNWNCCIVCSTVTPIYTILASGLLFLLPFFYYLMLLQFSPKPERSKLY